MRLLTSIAIFAFNLLGVMLLIPLFLLALMIYLCILASEAVFSFVDFLDELENKLKGGGKYE